MKSKKDAVLFLLEEFRKDYGTRARMIRTEKALALLGLEGEEKAAIMCHLDYWETMDGKPYPKYKL